MHAIHGGQAKQDKINAPKIAALLRGGLRPQASGSPAERRATRALWRRRTHGMRKRAELLAHGQPTTSPYPRPELGETSADTTNRDGVAERCAAPAVPKTMAVDWALLPSEDARLTALELSIVPPAPPHDAHPFSRRRAIPGGGTIWALGMR